MVHISYLQPFVDVNKRTSRLAANIPLIRSNLCPLSFVEADERDYILGTLAIYEQQRPELLRDFFVTAYERSAAQYRVVRDSVVQPDPLRLKYRSELNQIIATMVRAGERPDAARIRDLSQRLSLSEQDRTRFVELALELLLNLNAASAARSGLTEAAFYSWLQRVSTHPKGSAG